MAVGEFELIQQYFHREAGGEGVVLGIGDDCALLQVPEGKQLAVSMDTLIADVHFPANADPGLIAERALRVNLSDLAAMGAEPLWFTLALSLPDADEHWLDSFSEGLFAAAHRYDCTLVGGDTTRGPLSITIQVHGSLTPGKALLRGNASPGDRIFVTGKLGDGAAALAALEHRFEVQEEHVQYFADQYYRPTPRLKEGQRLKSFASAALDISDGLLADLGHICEQSLVGAEVAVECLPISEPLAFYGDQCPALDWALCGGDDYELCFTVPEKNLSSVKALISMGELVATEIGEIVSGSQVLCKNFGEVYEPPHSGYQHFEP